MALGPVLLTAEEIARRVEALAAEIRRDYGGRPLTLLAILHGAVVFVSDLMRHLDGGVASRSSRRPATATARPRAAG